MIIIMGDHGEEAGMKAYTVIGYVIDGEIYCTECCHPLASENAHPIFAGDEGEFNCADCGDNLMEGWS